jgi:hypothetical protein
MLATARVGTADPSADFDFDGDVDEADLATLRSHLRHADHSSVPTPVARTTWRGVKHAYRGDR